MVLALACTAGCSVLNPPSASSGLLRQVISGERISAATRAHASRQPLGPAATPAPAADRRKVPGGQVTAIGDSVMAASAMALESVPPGIYIDATPSRQMPAGLEVVRCLAASGLLRPVVVVGLGTNYIVTTGELNRLVRLLDTIRHRISLLWPDKVHRQLPGTSVYARMVYRAVQATHEAPGTLPARGL